MMAEHLPEIFSPGLNVQNKHLLQPKCHFNEIIAFEEAIHFDLRIVRPYFSDIPPVRTVANNVESDGEGNGIVGEIPALFCEPS